MDNKNFKIFLQELGEYVQQPKSRKLSPQSGVWRFRISRRKFFIVAPSVKRTMRRGDEIEILFIFVFDLIFGRGMYTNFFLNLFKDYSREVVLLGCVYDALIDNQLFEIFYRKADRFVGIQHGGGYSRSGPTPIAVTKELIQYDTFLKWVPNGPLVPTRYLQSHSVYFIMRELTRLHRRPKIRCVLSNPGDPYFSNPGYFKRLQQLKSIVEGLSPEQQAKVVLHIHPSANLKEHTNLFPKSITLVAGRVPESVGIDDCVIVDVEDETCEYLLTFFGLNFIKLLRSEEEFLTAYQHVMNSRMTHRLSCLFKAIKNKKHKYFLNTFIMLGLDV